MLEESNAGLVGAGIFMIGIFIGTIALGFHVTIKATEYVCDKFLCPKAKASK